MNRRKPSKKSAGFVPKLIATIVIMNVTATVLVALSIMANALINGDGLASVVVGFMTYAVAAVAAVCSCYGLFKLWSQPL